MKQNIILLLIFAATFVGCKNANEVPDALVGNWQLIEWRTSDESAYKAWVGNVTKISLTENSQFTAQGYFGDGNGRYEYDGKYLYFYFEDDTDPMMVLLVDSLSKDEIIVIMESDYYFKFKKQ